MEINYCACYQTLCSQQYSSSLKMLGYCYCEGVFSSKQNSDCTSALLKSGEKIKRIEAKTGSTEAPIYKRVPTVILKQEAKQESSEILCSPFLNLTDDEDEPIVVKITFDADLSSNEGKIFQNEIGEISEFIEIRENSQVSNRIGKIKNIHWRKDVVIKTIIRSMKRFYSKRFRAFTKLIGYQKYHIWNSRLMIEGASKLREIY